MYWTLPTSEGAIMRIEYYLFHVLEVTSEFRAKKSNKKAMNRHLEQSEGE